jgi:hypothetical protein
LKERLADIDWCNNLLDLLRESTEHDTREKILETIKTLLSACSYKFELKTAVKTLKELVQEYDNLASADDNDSYFRTISDLANNIKDHLVNIKNKIMYQQEL